MRPIHARIALPALLLAGCGLLYAEVELPSVELVLKDESFEGTTLGGELTRDFTYDLGSDLDFITDNDVTVHLTLHRMEISSAATDLSTVESVSVEVVPPAGSGLPLVPLLEYQRPAGAAAPIHVVQAAASGDADLGPYLTAGVLTLRASATGALPTSPWLADVTAGFSLKVRVPYGKKI